MKATNLHHIGSSPAPKEWLNIPEINAHYPKQQNVEKSLQKLDGLDICVWMIGYGGRWSVASEFFHIELKEGS